MKKQEFINIIQNNLDQAKKRQEDLLAVRALYDGMEVAYEYVLKLAELLDEPTTRTGILED